MSTLLSVRDAAKVIGCKEDTVRYYIRTGRLHPEKVGHALVFTREEVERFAEARRVMKPQETSPVA